MPFGGGGQSSTQTIQKADPWSGVQPALTSMYNAALANFQGNGQQYYPGSTVATPSGATTQSQWGILGLAQQPTPGLDAANKYITNLTNSDPTQTPGGQALYNLGNTNFAQTNPAMQQMLGLGNNDYASTSPYMQALMQTTGGKFGDIAGANQLLGLGGSDASNNQSTAGLNALGQRNFFQTNPAAAGLGLTASGAYLNSNPYVDAMFGRQASQVGGQFANSVMPGVASMYSQGGRFGSGAMGQGLQQAQQQFGNTLNDLAANTYGQNYANERQLQQGAQNSLGQFGLTNDAQRAAALSSAGQMSLQGRQLQQQALGQAGSENLTQNAQNQQALTNLGQMGLQSRNLQQQALQNYAGNSLQGQSLQQSALTNVMDQYRQQQQMRLQAATLAPSLNQAQYYGAQQANAVGQQQDAYQQSLINADVNRFNFNQQQPNAKLQFLSSILNGFPSGQSTQQTQTGGTNQFLNTLGGVNAAAGTYRNLSGLFGDASAGLGADAAGNAFAAMLPSLADNPFLLAAL